jgi:hypothetical protein
MRCVARRYRGALALAAVILAQLLVACGGGSSGSGGQPPPPPSNPVPAIVSLSPSSTNAGGAAFTVTITGYNFVSSSSVQWNGSARTTTYSSGTQLQVQITASDIASSGSATLSVTNPTPGGGSSGSAEFTINPTSNPAPQLQASDPSSVDAGSSDIIFTVYGSNFIPTSVIQWNGVALTTSYLSDSYLVAQVPASNLANPGVAEVVVVTPGPGGGSSTSLQFDINGFSCTPLVASQLANDMVWDPVNQVIYLSVPSLASANGNTIAVLNPTSGSIQSTQFAGSEPDALAISDDSQFLYAGLDGSSSVQRFILPGLTPDINYLLGAGSYPEGPFFGLDLQVAPGLPHTTAVSRGAFNDGAQIYGANSDTTSFDFYTFAVSSSGITLQQDYPSVFWNEPGRIQYDSTNRLVYSDDGFHVINPATGLPAGLIEGGGAMTPDSSLDSVFVLTQYIWQGNSNYTIDIFDMTHYVRVGWVPFPTTALPGFNPLGRFIRWGSNGLALNFKGDQIYLLTGSFISNPQKARAKQIRKTVRAR